MLAGIAGIEVNEICKISAITPTTVRENEAYASVAPVLTGDSCNAINFTYELAGDDKNSFTVDSSTGVISMGAKNYETDQKTYNVTLNAKDEDDNIETQTLTLTLTNVAEITSITGPSDLTYFPGASLPFIVTYEENVTVNDNDGSGKPKINLNIKSIDLGEDYDKTGEALYSSALTTEYRSDNGIAHSKDIIFEYIVGDDHTDTDGIEITDLSINLNNGTIKGTSNASDDASLDFSNITLPNLEDVLLDAKMWNIMKDAGFVYIPSMPAGWDDGDSLTTTDDWDVNGDEVADEAFWIAKYEAKDTSNSVTIANYAPTAGNASGEGGLRKFMSESFNVYYAYIPPPTVDPVNYDDPVPATNGRFTDNSVADGVYKTNHKLCDEYYASPSGDCRENSYLTTKTLTDSFDLASDIYNFDVNKVEFKSGGTPYVDETLIEAAIAIKEFSDSLGGETIELPSKKQLMQVTNLIVNNKVNWTGVKALDATISSAASGYGPLDNSTNLGNLGNVTDVDEAGVLFKGFITAPTTTPLTHTALAASADDAQGYQDTGTINDNTFSYRRTHVIANNIKVIDSNGNSILIKDPAVAEDYTAVIWDFAGNVSEWTKDLIKANGTDNYLIPGGDRFITGNRGWNNYDYDARNAGNKSLDNVLKIPSWLIASVNENGTQTLLNQNTFYTNIGMYYDGQADSGALDTVNLGYNAPDTYAAGYVGIVHGGTIVNSGNSNYATGVNTLYLNYGPGYHGIDVGFRAATTSRHGTKGSD